MYSKISRSTTYLLSRGAAAGSIGAGRRWLKPALPEQRAHERRGAPLPAAARQRRAAQPEALRRRAPGCPGSCAWPGPESGCAPAWSPGGRLQAQAWCGTSDAAGWQVAALVLVAQAPQMPRRAGPPPGPAPCTRPRSSGASRRLRAWSAGAGVVMGCVSASVAQLDVDPPFHLPKPVVALARGVAVPGIGVPHKRGRRGARRRRSL
jgi:hypothetical protein